MRKREPAHGTHVSLRGAPGHAAVRGSGCIEKRALPAQQVQLRRHAASAERRARVRCQGRPGERVHERRGGGPQPEDNMQRSVDKGCAHRLVVERELEGLVRRAALAALAALPAALAVHVTVAVAVQGVGLPPRASLSERSRPAQHAQPRALVAERGEGGRRDGGPAAVRTPRPVVGPVRAGGGRVEQRLRPHPALLRLQQLSRDEPRHVLARLRRQVGTH
eukprot:scaffold55662_cov69-Phaeocystis_antarctica.AAC.2